ncbi:MAG TPA: hypothetical protein VE264_01460 [Nitrososphaera sp.]|jgi:hypothetical protein|nr:hypothetical protein [Nitrososphaera sp.]
MSLHDISLKRLAIIIIAAGVIIVFALSGFQARNLFAPSITEDAQVIIKNQQDGTCVVEGSDRVPRTISNCLYNTGDTVSISYKSEQPSIERHELVQSGSADANGTAGP